jgi:hypothetical protein
VKPDAVAYVVSTVAAAVMTRRADEYRQLARECLKLANGFPDGRARTALIDMAYQWARLADEQEGATDLRNKE